jgi:hypothetical protein
MGGPGSVSVDRWGAKLSTAACDRLDLGSLYRGGGLRPGAVGTVTWSRGERVTSSIGWAALGEEGIATALELRYAVGGEVIRYAVPLEWTACRFGGWRPWFACPGEGCGRRVAVLYGRRLFLCRHCHGLAYASTRESAGERATRKAQKVRMRLGGTANLLAPFPPKPKGMHWRTYARLRAAEEAAAGVRQAEFAAWAARTEAWLERLGAGNGDEGTTGTGAGGIGGRADAGP